MILKKVAYSQEHQSEKQGPPKCRQATFNTTLVYS